MFGIRNSRCARLRTHGASSPGRTSVFTSGEKPGAFRVFWLPSAVGGYSKVLGWKPDSEPLTAGDCCPPAEVEELSEGDAKDHDLASQSHAWQTIAEHTNEVDAFLNGIVDSLGMDDTLRRTLKLAARWHDWGKRHPVFQAAIKDGAGLALLRPSQWAAVDTIAKAPQQFWQRYERKHFRHELASALGVLTLLRIGQAPAEWADLASHLQNLALYLIAAHHGKVRLSIRSMPGENTPDNPGTLFARGVWENDSLPSVDLGGNILAPSVPKLDLTSMLLGRTDGQPSWTERMLGLRDHKEFGPLKLAYLETVLRAADIRASKAADDKIKGVTL